MGFLHKDFYFANQIKPLLNSSQQSSNLIVKLINFALCLSFLLRNSHLKPSLSFSQKNKKTDDPKSFSPGEGFMRRLKVIEFSHKLFK